MIRLMLAIAVLGVSAPALAQDRALAWPAVRKQIEADWKKGYAKEKILRIEKKGPLQYYSSERRTELLESWGWVWGSVTIETQGAYARQVAHVTIERPNKTQARFEVAALYQRAGNAWGYRKLAVGDSKDLTAAKAGDLPSGAQAAALFTEAWRKLRPDFEVHSVEVLKSEPKQYQDRRWISYKLAIAATGTDKGSRSMYQKKYRCTPETYSSVLRFKDGQWLPDEGMIKNVNESRDCSLAK